MNQTREQLEARTVAELKRMCVYDFGIAGMSKKRKDEIIDAIIGHQASSDVVEAVSPTVTSLQGDFSSVLTKPEADRGSRTTTTLRVSCGASSGDFDVVGKTVGAVAEFLREILNVDRLAAGIVNGNTVDDSYVLQTGDNLEYLKPAGRKGC